MDVDKIQHRCNWLLVALLGKKDLAELWWRSPNQMFDMQTPTSVFQSDPERVYSYLLSMTDGGW